MVSPGLATSACRLTTWRALATNSFPLSLTRKVVDYWVKTGDGESFAMGRVIVRHEGLLIGGSCGATMAGAYKFTQQNKVGAGKRVGVLFADSSRNYMSKFMNDDGMSTEGFMTENLVQVTREKGLFGPTMICRNSSATHSRRRGAAPSSECPLPCIPEGVAQALFADGSQPRFACCIKKSKLWAKTMLQRFGSS